MGLFQQTGLCYLSQGRILFEKGGSILGLQSQKKGGSRRGSNFGPNVKKPISWPKKGGLDPLDPPMGCISRDRGRMWGAMADMALSDVKSNFGQFEIYRFLA